MRRKAVFAVLALICGALTLSNHEPLARDFGSSANARPAAHSSSSTRARGWIQLHRLDGEVTRINVNQILFVTNAKNMGGNERAKSRIQLVNGFSDVLETVDEVMHFINEGDALGTATSSVFDDTMSSPRIDEKEN
jgi:hypothetical protein